MNNLLGLRIVTTTLAGVMTISMVACKQPSDTGGSTAPVSVGTEIDDSLITTKIKAALINDASIKSLDISVSTHNGEVQLSGFVNNQEQVDRAVEVSKAVTGVSQVLNNMKIKK